MFVDIAGFEYGRIWKNRLKGVGLSSRKDGSARDSNDLGKMLGQLTEKQKNILNRWVTVNLHKDKWFDALKKEFSANDLEPFFNLFIVDRIVRSDTDSVKPLEPDLSNQKRIYTLYIIDKEYQKTRHFVQFFVRHQPALENPSQQILGSKWMEPVLWVYYYIEYIRRYWTEEELFKWSEDRCNSPSAASALMLYGYAMAAGPHLVKRDQARWKKMAERVLEWIPRLPELTGMLKQNIRTVMARTAEIKVLTEQHERELLA